MSNEDLGSIEIIGVAQPLPILVTCPVCNAQVELLPEPKDTETEELYQQPCDSCGSMLSLHVKYLPTLR